MFRGIDFPGDGGFTFLALVQQVLIRGLLLDPGQALVIIFLEIFLVFHLRLLLRGGRRHGRAHIRQGFRFFLVRARLVILKSQLRDHFGAYAAGLHNLFQLVAVGNGSGVLDRLDLANANGLSLPLFPRVLSISVLVLLIAFRFGYLAHLEIGVGGNHRILHVLFHRRHGGLIF